MFVIYSVIFGIRIIVVQSLVIQKVKIINSIKEREKFN